jgi:hypothetical protein
VKVRLSGGDVIWTGWLILVKITEVRMVSPLIVSTSVYFRV